MYITWYTGGDTGNHVVNVNKTRHPFTGTSPGESKHNFWESNDQFTSRDEEQKSRYKENST